MKSVLKRMLFLPLVLVIPINVLLIAASILNLRLSRKELISSGRNYLELVAADIERDISEADANLQFYIGNDAGFLRLNHYSDINLKNADFYLDFMSTAKKLDEFEVRQANVEASFLLPDRSGQLFRRAGFPIKAREESEILTALSGAESGIVSFLSGDAENPALYKFFRSRAIWTGYCLSFSDYLDKLNYYSIKPASIWIGAENDYPDSNGSHAKQILLSREIKNANVLITVIYDSDAFNLGISSVVRTLMFFSLIALWASPLLIYYYYRQIYYPTLALKKGIDKVRSGETDYRVPVDHLTMDNEFTDLTRYFNEMMDSIREMQKNVYELRLRQQETLMNYYSQQIRPHFILNALNTIYTCKENEWDYAKEMLLYLTRYFRYIVNIRKREVYLSEEMNFLKNYLEIQKHRLGDYFFSMVTWEHELENAAIPPLVIHTFVENSIKYSLEEGKTCCIAVMAECIYDQHMRIRISDTGKGFPEEVLHSIDQYSMTRKVYDNLGMGIVNTLERLRMYYGEDLKMILRNENGAVVELILPVLAVGEIVADGR